MQIFLKWRLNLISHTFAYFFMKRLQSLIIIFQRKSIKLAPVYQKEKQLNFKCTYKWHIAFVDEPTINKLSLLLVLHFFPSNFCYKNPQVLGMGKIIRNFPQLLFVPFIGVYTGNILRVCYDRLINNSFIVVIKNVLSAALN